MTHRADQIIEAAAEAIDSWTPSIVRVFTHRRESLAEDHDELPAISVDFGEDEPFDAADVSDGGAFLMDGTFQSLLTLNITGAALARDEPELRRELLKLRTYVHIGIRRHPTLSLPFVIDTHYGGANTPIVDTSGDIIVGELTAPWGVRYEMNPDSPE